MLIINSACWDWDPLLFSKLFERAGVEYTTIVVGEKENQCPSEVFRKEYPDVIGFPFVVIDGEQIGGLVEVAKLFLEKNLVSVKKKWEKLK